MPKLKKILLHWLIAEFSGTVSSSLYKRGEVSKLSTQPPGRRARYACAKRASQSPTLPTNHRMWM
ncbi:hypothetical protein IMZ48_13805 [Candidatus Bathyarchaeota archaeon]|nr:hypothetical protein [Candidatus Bathyarchaeota archaeon]